MMWTREDVDVANIADVADDPVEDGTTGEGTGAASVVGVSLYC